jgi:uncharacterized protein (DUF3820 family)
MPERDPLAPLGDPTLLVELANTRMPFGKYQGRLLIHLPEPYLAWFAREGFPKGRLGSLLSTTLEIKMNGLVGLVEPLVRSHNPHPE